MPSPVGRTRPKNSIPRYINVDTSPCTWGTIFAADCRFGIDTRLRSRFHNACPAGGHAGWDKPAPAGRCAGRTRQLCSLSAFEFAWGGLYALPPNAPILNATLCESSPVRTSCTASRGDVSSILGTKAPGFRFRPGLTNLPAFQRSRGEDHGEEEPQGKRNEQDGDRGP